jgi:hypothetical protein
MPVSKNVETLLDTLTKYKVNPQTIASLRKDLDSNKAASGYLDAGIIRRNQFTEYISKTEKEKKELQTQITELATLHDAAGSTSIDPTLVQSLTEKIAAIEDYLIEQGYDEDEVRNISFKEKTALTESLRNENLQAQQTIDDTVIKKEEEEDMPNGKYVDEETFKTNLQTSVADMTLNQMQIQSEISRQIRRYEKLYGREVDESLVDNFTATVVDSILKGEQKTVPQIAESHFKISEREEKNREEEFNQRLETARREERAKVLRETGVPARTSARTGGSPIFRTQKFETSTTAQTDQTSQQVTNPPPNPPSNQDAPAGMVKLANGKTVPVNKEGVPEYFRGRRSQDERVESGVNFYNEVVEKVGEEGERMGFME